MVQVTQEIVREVYRGVLGREPESDHVVELHAVPGRPLAGMLADTIGGEEFMSRFRQRGEGDLLFDGLVAGDEDLLRRHIAPAEPHPDFVSTFIGTRARTSLVAGLDRLAGHVFRDIPTRVGDISAEAIEYVGTIKAVEAGSGRFVVAELGAGNGTWCVHAGHLARKLGRDPIRLYAVEGSAERVENLKIHFADNGFDPAQQEIHAAVIGPKDGYALFPQINILDNWGAEALFVEQAEPRPGYDMVQSISLPSLLAAEPVVDLLHFDIQGAEADVIEGSIDFLNERVRYMVVGTHGREVEYRILVALRAAGWVLENESPARFDRSGGGEHLRCDGTHVWRNPRV